jgi:hypothetical protein
LASLAGIAVLVAVGYSVVPSVVWDGAVPAEIHVSVVDAGSGHPIPGATVSFRNSLSPESFFAKRSYVADPAGRAAVAALIPAGGKAAGVYRTIRMNTDTCSILASAQGYTDTEYSLSILDDFRFIRFFRRDEPIILEIRVPMEAIKPAGAGTHPEHVN